MYIDERVTKIKKNLLWFVVALKKLGGDASNDYNMYLDGAMLCYDSDIQIPEMVQGECLVIAKSSGEVMDESSK